MYFLQRKDRLPPKTPENKGKFYYVSQQGNGGPHKLCSQTGVFQALWAYVEFM